ncbi:hypothetical protein IFM89_024063 [Coptis chinensis]|uniref:Uncharacterized protein n=1 Tax=Coptis chinensis TaxID=261450 RepID=A0A835HXM4_9MAGN|nr:hypothetical protein IFM89_024063 [Coptis chinensis]
MWSFRETTDPPKGGGSNCRYGFLWRLFIGNKRKLMELELEKSEEELLKYKKQAEATLDANAKALDELDSIKRVKEELKLNLERA